MRRRPSWLPLLAMCAALGAGEAPAPVALTTGDLVATIEGEAIHANELTIAGLILNDVAALPALANQVLTFSGCQATLYGGTVKGTIAMDFTAARVRIVADLAGVDLAGLLQGLGSSSESYSGRVSGRLDLTFPLGRPNEAQGHGRLEIVDGNLVELSFLTNLLVGDVANVRGQDNAEASFDVRDGQVVLSSARVTLPKGTVLVSGSISLEGDLRLLVIPRVSGGLLSQVWVVGKWFGAALAVASSRVARVVVRGNITRPVVVLNPFAAE
jgi:hypothetical protein